MCSSLRILSFETGAANLRYLWFRTLRCEWSIAQTVCLACCIYIYNIYFYLSSFLSNHLAFTPWFEIAGFHCIWPCIVFRLDWTLSTVLQDTYYTLGPSELAKDLLRDWSPPLQKHTSNAPWQKSPGASGSSFEKGGHSTAWKGFADATSPHVVWSGLLSLLYHSSTFAGVSSEFQRKPRNM